MQWRRPLLLGLLALASARGAAADRVWVVVEEPGDRSVQLGTLGLVEVRGRAGVGRKAGHDVVIAFDLSGSTLLASGVDVDGDGRLGRASRKVTNFLKRGIRPLGALGTRHFSSDPGDTIREAEIVAAGRLVELLELTRTRVGLVSFDDRARVEAPLGSSREEITAALARIQEKARFRMGATNFRDAILESVDVLRDGSGPDEPQRLRSIVFLSDGQPTYPPPEHTAKRKALEAAGKAAEAEVHIHSFALGPEAIEHFGVYTELAEITGGGFTRVEQPGEVVALLPTIDLAGIAQVDLHNLTTGGDGRAVRVLPDGSFDGFVKLAPGENRLRVRARSPDGTAAFAERRVFFEKREPRDEEEARRFRADLERMHRELLARTAEAELRAEMKRVRAAERQGRELELDVE